MRARAEPGLHAFTFLTDGGTEELRITYGDLDRRARAIGAVLQEQGATGERALLVYPSGLEYIAAFFGCLYAETVAVPAPLPRPNRPSTQIEAIVADSRPVVALTSSTSRVADDGS